MITDCSHGPSNCRTAFTSKYRWYNGSNICLSCRHMLQLSQNSDEHKRMCHILRTPKHTYRMFELLISRLKWNSQKVPWSKLDQDAVPVMLSARLIRHHKYTLLHSSSCRTDSWRYSKVNQMKKLIHMKSKTHRPGVVTNSCWKYWVGWSVYPSGGSTLTSTPSMRQTTHRPSPIPRRAKSHEGRRYTANV